MSDQIQQFFVTGGTLQPGAPSYVERDADKKLLAHLLRGEFCYALTSRQMGKSSLMAHTARRLRERNIAVAVLDLTSVGQNLTAEQWYDGLMAKLGAQIGLEDELMEFWRSHETWGPLQRFTSALEEVVLPRVVQKCPPGRPAETAGLVIFVDEIDVVQSLPFSTDEFFAGIRACYNRRAENARLNALTFCLLGVAAPHELIRDVRTTPFNIGQRIELHDFTEEEAQPLREGLMRGAGANRSPATAAGLLKRILYWTGGHPYLTQRLCRAVAEDSSASKPADVDRHCESLFLSTKARERDDNLIFVRERMLGAEKHRAEILSRYYEILRGAAVADDSADRTVTLLHLAGIVRAENGLLEPRNRIYERIFDRHWVKKNLPAGEVIRQRQAFHRGIKWAAAAAAAALLLALGLLLFQKDSLQQQVLGDGTTVMLNAVTYGKNHRFEPGRLRLGALAQLLPPLKRLAYPVAHQDSANDSLGIWISRRDSAEQALGMDWWTDYRIVDEHGCLFSEGGNRTQYMFNRGGLGSSSYGGGSTFPTLPPGTADYMIGHALLPSFPRHSKSFGLELLGADAKKVAEFQVINPAVKSPEIWVTEAVPSAKQAGDLTFTFQGWDVKKKRPRFEVLEHGKPIDSWEPLRITYIDSTGNESTRAWGLCLHEPAWKVRAEFFRNRKGRFTGNEQWQISNLPVPAPGQIISLLRTNTLGGVQVALRAFVGGGEYDYVDGVPTMVRAAPPGQSGGLSISSRSGKSYNVFTGTPHLALRIEQRNSDAELSFFCVDDQGREVNRSSWGTSGQENFWSLNLPAEAKSITFSIALHKGQTIEYIVRPPAPEKP